MMKESINKIGVVLLLYVFSTTAAYAQKRILFIGNSFTFQGPVPEIVRALAIADGQTAPEVHYLDDDDEDNAGSKSIGWHLANQATLALISQRWDHVVVQEFSTLPTDNIGNPLLFKKNATRIYDLIKTHNPSANVFFYETWARHQHHNYYREPKQFTNPEQMQLQLRTHYNDAVDNYIPANTTIAEGVNNDLFMIPVGDAWENYYSFSNTSIHNGDLYHANTHGRYLNALVIYAKIFNVAPPTLTSNLSFLDKRENAYNYNIDDAIAKKLQQAAKQALNSSPTEPIPIEDEFADGDIIEVDFGSPAATTEGYFNNLTAYHNGASLLQKTTDGRVTDVSIVVSDAFQGINSNGLTNNTLNFMSSATRDSFWTGSFNGHIQALARPGQVTINNLNPNHSYTLKLFASRSGDDGGRSRLTRYTIHKTFKDLEVSDNRDTQVIFDEVKPNSDGSINIDIAVSPDNNARFAYLGILSIKNNGLGYSETPPIKDTSAPVITMTTATVSLSGSASDNVAVESVTWYCQTGCPVSSGNANVEGDDWQVNQLSLSKSNSTLRIEAVDTAGNSSVETLGFQTLSH